MWNVEFVSAGGWQVVSSHLTRAEADAAFGAACVARPDWTVRIVELCVQRDGVKVPLKAHFEPAGVK